MNEVGESAPLLNALTKVAAEENLDPYRTTVKIFACKYAMVKKYAENSSKMCIYLLGL